MEKERFFTQEEVENLIDLILKKEKMAGRTVDFLGFEKYPPVINEDNLENFKDYIVKNLDNYTDELYTKEALENDLTYEIEKMYEPWATGYFADYDEKEFEENLKLCAKEDNDDPFLKEY